MAIALAAMAAVALAYVAPADARGLRPGVRNAAPSSRALSAALEQTAGVSPSQVTTKDVCSAARPGHARCAAQALVLRSNHALVRPHARRQATFGRVKPASLLPGFVAPATASAAAAPNPGTPAYLQQAYDLVYLSQNRGFGDTIAVVDPYDDPTAESDLAAYRAQYGLPACTSTNGCFTKVNEFGNASPLPAPNSTWEQEISLDLDAVSALCPNCHIVLVEASTDNSPDLAKAMSTAASKGVNQISASWTIGISNGILSGAYVFPHISTVAATGDTGYLPSGTDNFPAAFSKVTAAGGTTLAPTGGARGFSEGAWALNSQRQGASSGCASQVTKPSYQTDTGCTKRAYSDLSADADPASGLLFYDSQNPGNHWGVIGGTSLAAPLIAAYYAITGVDGTTPQWAYTDSALLNDPASGSNGNCVSAIRYICTAGRGYDGPTGVGAISGAVAGGAPGIGGAPITSGNSTTYTQSTRSRGATLAGGIYPNGWGTSWWIEYGTSTSYGNQTPATDIGQGTAPVAVTGYLSGLAPATTYHYRLVAQNSLGRTYGYDYSFTTDQSSVTDPIANFSAPSATAPTSTTTFDARTSSDDGASITDYTWDFGDGQTTGGPTATANHTYTSLGTYNVTLIVTNSDGASDSITQQITVDNPTASFTAPQTVAPGAQASFNASASSDPLGTITDYSWDFGDGSQPDDTRTTQTDTHAFANRGTYAVTLTITNSLGQQVTASHDVTVDTAPTASFTPPTGIQAIKTPLSFDGTGSSALAPGTIQHYTWDFGDSTAPVDTQTSAIASHSYNAAGMYTVRLTVKDDLGLTDTTTRTVTVDHPAAAFAVPATPTPGASADFDASSSIDPEGSIINYSWDFGDGTLPDDTGTTASDTHTFAHRGTYHVTLTVKNDSNQTDQITHDVTVDNPPTAFVTPSAIVATPGTSLSFNGTASEPGDGGTISHYIWDFGDGSPPEDTGITASDSHVYEHPGPHTITLTVKDDLGITSTATQIVTIDQPTAAFTAPPTAVSPNSPAGFDASGSSDLAGNITDYSWDFGDNSGTTDTGDSATTTHSYSARGLYHVTLTVTNNSLQTNQITHDVTIDTAPTAAFSTPASAQVPGSPASFDASASTFAPGNMVASYHWAFGDGAVGSGVSTSHSYAIPGPYTVSLTVTDDLGVSNTTTHQVTVDAAPSASFSASPNPATAGPSVAFDGSGSSDTVGAITSYSWEFGDGATGSGATASHPYAAPGRYTVTLKVTNDAGQTATVRHSVTVDAPPKALFSVSPTAVTTGAAVAFNASSSSDDVGTITDYSWSFGDGTRASGPTASHSYASPGTYTVGLTVTNDAGQSTSSSQTVSVYSAPVASFSIAPGVGQQGAAVGFNAGSSSDPGGAITAYGWSFGDGATASGPTPTHAYANPGTYTVTLTVTGSLGLVTSTSHAVTINPRPLSVQFSSSRQSAKTVLKHGLKVTLSTSAPAKASFVVAMPAPTVKQKRKHSKRVVKQRMSTILRSGVFSFAPGAHTVSLKLSAAGSSKLRDAGKPVVLTVQMTLTDIYGRTASRSVKVTVTR